MNKYLSLLLFICFTTTLFAQQFVSSTLLNTKTQGQLSAEFGLPFIQFGVKNYRIEYTSMGAQGQMDTLSGLLTVPDNNQKIYPKLVYQHGTSGDKLDVPSFNVTSGGEGRIGGLFAGLGYVTLAPDYLGLGVSHGFHPYVHAATEASAALDLLRAAQTFFDQNGISVNNQLFITGYSQGGHGAMALHREIETNLGNEFTVTAAAPMSGPYSISGVMRDLILGNQEYYYPAYIPNTALSYQTVYGNLFSQITDVFKPAYAGLIGQFYTGEISLSQLNDQLIAALIANEGASIPTKMLTDNIIQAVTTNPDHPINLALAANDVYKWTPQAPTRLFYCMADDQVPFMNSIVARDTMLANGAVDFATTDVNPLFDHGQCVTPAVTNTIFFFAGFQQIGALLATTALESGGLELSPNPARDAFSIRELPGAGQLSVFDYFGKTYIDMKMEGDDREISAAGLPNGVYVVRYEVKGKIWQERLVIQR